MTASWFSDILLDLYKVGGSITPKGGKDTIYLIMDLVLMRP